MLISIDLVNGLVFGIEHMDVRELEEESDWVIFIHFLCFRIMLEKLKA